MVYIEAGLDDGDDDDDDDGKWIGIYGPRNLRMLEFGGTFVISLYIKYMNYDVSKHART